MRDKILNWFLGVFDNSQGGGSMRKIIAIILVAPLLAISTIYLILLWKGRYNLDFAETLIEYFLIAILTLLGMVQVQGMFSKKTPPLPPIEPPKEEEKKPD